MNDISSNYSPPRAHALMAVPYVTMLGATFRSTIRSMMSNARWQVKNNQGHTALRYLYGTTHETRRQKEVQSDRKRKSWLLARTEFCLVSTPEKSGNRQMSRRLMNLLTSARILRINHVTRGSPATRQLDRKRPWCS